MAHDVFGEAGPQGGLAPPTLMVVRLLFQQKRLACDDQVRVVKKQPPDDAIAPAHLVVRRTD